MDCHGRGLPRGRSWLRLPERVLEAWEGANPGGQAGNPREWSTGVSTRGGRRIMTSLDVGGTGQVAMLGGWTRGKRPAELRGSSVCLGLL